jgi:hypothetical protein
MTAATIHVEKHVECVNTNCVIVIYCHVFIERLSLLRKDGFVISEAVIGNPVLGKIKEFSIPVSAGMTKNPKG